MTNEEAIKFLQQLYPNGGHCWLDEQRMEAIGMAVKALQEEPVSEEQVKEDTMTIRKEWFEHCQKSWYNEGYIDGEYNRDRQFEDTVSDDLEEASEEYAYTNWQSDDYHDGAAEGLPFDAIGHTQKTFKAGAKWKAEQFEKERLKLCNTLTKEQAQIEQDFVVNFIKNNNCTPTFIDAIEYGMKIQKEQMMAKVVDGIARPDDDEVWCDLKSFNFKDGDKVKVIVIKKD